MPHQRLTCSGFVMASNTRRLGASNRRVSTISRSDGVVALKVSLFATMPAAMFLLLGCKFLQVGFETIETLFPDDAVPLGPVRHFLERRRFEAARPPLGLASPDDEPCALEYAQV